jgi:hypothetical protein
MGADEFEAYADLMATSRFERSLWLDTTMVLGTMKDEYGAPLGLWDMGAPHNSIDYA